MKTAILSTLLFLGLASVSFSQTKEKAKEIQKEIKVEVENGKTVMTIITTDGDKVTEEVFEGAAAEAKLKEFQENVEFKEESQSVKLEDHDGQKTLTVTTIKDGKTTEEIFIGTQAEKKMKEMGIQASQMKKVEAGEIMQ
ncbi:MAG TPA: hypothetical protein EYG86_00420 [Crocinitomicaceae bacterium]|nr:hypothetical protein [Crocinitomicaceae bacterium]